MTKGSLMASPALSGRWCGFTREVKARSIKKRLATLAEKHGTVSEAHTAILHACDVDRVLRLRSEADIKLEQEAKIAAYFTRKRTVWMAAALTLLCLWPALASAQTATPAPMVNPTKVEFACSPDHALQDPAGGPIVTGYSLEVWAPGTDTVQGIPAMGTGEILKGLFSVTGPTCSLDLVKIPGWGNTFTIPKGPTYVMTITTRGPGGSARSPVSNFFTFPLPTPVPRPVSGVSVK